CLLIPATMLVDARTLAPLLADPPEGAGTAVTDSPTVPVLLLPSAAVERFAAPLAAGAPLAQGLARHAAETRPKPLSAAGLCFLTRDAADLDEAERLLYAGLGTDNDTGVDQYLHRRCSRWITRALVRTPATPNQVSALSLAIGLVAVWCFWHATAPSAALGVLCYALACIVDHSDGELARLTFQESRLGAHLDWAIDTIIHAGLVLAMAVSSEAGAAGVAIGVVGASGVALSALFARYLPREIAVGETVGGALKNMGNRDLFYALLLVFVLLRAVFPSALPVLALVVAMGSQSYWVACVSRIRRGRRAV
ncbi:MAG TPA: CDP-alcohol phosphatidyltransferase family protein, partial [Methylomirabilota bacterium]|nr:CDP-alcohol phosphatidyltransferase family protein [Methylomirabilota bacterium]